MKVYLIMLKTVRKTDNRTIDEKIIDSFTTEELAKKDLQRIIKDFYRFGSELIINEHEKNEEEETYNTIETERLKYMYWIKTLIVHDKLY